MHTNNTKENIHKEHLSVVRHQRLADHGVQQNHLLEDLKRRADDAGLARVEGGLHGQDQLLCFVGCASGVFVPRVGPAVCPPHHASSVIRLLFESCCQWCSYDAANMRLSGHRAYSAAGCMCPAVMRLFFDCFAVVRGVSRPLRLASCVTPLRR